MRRKWSKDSPTHYPKLSKSTDLQLFSESAPFPGIDLVALEKEKGEEALSLPPSSSQKKLILSVVWGKSLSGGLLGILGNPRPS